MELKTKYKLSRLGLKSSGSSVLASRWDISGILIYLKMKQSPHAGTPATKVIKS